MDDKVMSKEALDYFEREGLSQYFKATPTLALDAYQTIDPENKIPYGSDVEDLVRLHKLIRTRRVLTILEFGVGYSTLVMADALVKNKTDYEMQFKGLDIRCLNPFHLFCVDADEKWVDIARERIPGHLAEIVNFSISEVYIPFAL